MLTRKANGRYLEWLAFIRDKCSHLSELGIHPLANSAQFALVFDLHKPNVYGKPCL